MHVIVKTGKQHRLSSTLNCPFIHVGSEEYGIMRKTRWSVERISIMEKREEGISEKRSSDRVGGISSGIKWSSVYGTGRWEL